MIGFSIAVTFGEEGVRSDWQEGRGGLDTSRVLPHHLMALEVLSLWYSQWFTNICYRPFYFSYASTKRKFKTLLDRGDNKTRSLRMWKEMQSEQGWRNLKEKLPVNAGRCVFGGRKSKIFKMSSCCNFNFPSISKLKVQIKKI